MRISKFLDEVMRKQEIRRDKQLAEWLGVGAPSIAQYRSGTRCMDNEKCVKIALELGIDPIQIIMAADLDKAEKSGQKSLWEVFIKRTQNVKSAGVTAALFLTIVGTNIVTPTEARASADAGHSDLEQRCLYIMSN